MAILSQAGVPGAGFGILHPKHKNRWQVVFIGMTGQGINLTRQAVSVNRPQLEFNEIQMHRYNSVAFAASKHSWSPTSLTIEDDLTGLASSSVQQQLEKQQRLVGANAANGQFLNAAPTASAYKFGMRLEQLDGNETISELWMLEGCWIQSVDYGDLDYSNGDAVTISLSIRFDHARQQLNSAAAGAYGVQATAGFVANGALAATHAGG